MAISPEESVRRRRSVRLHVIVAMFTLMVLLTEGYTSPFFPFFIFLFNSTGLPCALARARLSSFLLGFWD